MIDPVRRVLFLCTGNSARSIIAECVLERLGHGRFQAYSAGSFPRGEVHPAAVRVLTDAGYTTAHLRSKPWDEFAAAGAPVLDFVFTVCDDAAGEACPLWPGRPVTAHWGMPDPAATPGGEGQIALAFANTLRLLTTRVGLFAGLPFASLDRVSLQRRLQDIGRAG